MADVREIAFELERFAWTEPGRLEVIGRWTGLEGRRLGRPVLRLEVEGRRRRLTAMPGGHLASESGDWRASFAFEGDPEQVDAVVLDVGRLSVELPRPRRRRRRPADGELERLRDELAAEQRRREDAEATLAERDAELLGLRDEADAALAAREADVETLREQENEVERERDRLRAALTAAEAERERLRTDLAIRDEELSIARDEAQTARNEAEQRLAAERAASTEVREKLATAREEADKTITMEAEETERLRAELAAARDETERTVEAERAETARLREELAARSVAPNGDDDGGEAEAAAKRMYERIARELEAERAAARSLRRELDAIQAETAEHRRDASSAAANGITDDVPAATPAGRLWASRQSEASRAAAHHRAEAARAAAAQRVPHTHRSPALVWGARVGALLFVAALLVLLVLIVSWVA